MAARLSVRSFCFALMVAMLGCGPTADGDGGNGNGGGNRDGGTTSNVDDAGNIINPPTDGGLIVQPDASCGAQTVPIAVMNLGDPPDMLIVLDRSGSMGSPIISFPPTFPPPVRWDVMKNALKMVTSARQTQIKFGLSAFPTDDNCAVMPGARVAVALNTATMIEGYLNGNGPQGNTPAHIGLQEAKNIFMSLPVNPAGRYVLFATDGEPNCGGAAMDQASENETIAAIQALRSINVKTFVLGFGDSFGSTGTAFLTRASTEGGVPRAGSPNFYAANNATDLQNALNTIAGGVVRPSCSYMLASPPPVPNSVTVSLSGTPVPRSTQHTDGWDYHPDANTITFFGGACAQVMSGMVTQVSFVYGCPGPVID